MLLFHIEMIDDQKVQVIVQLKAQVSLEPGHSLS